MIITYFSPIHLPLRSLFVIRSVAFSDCSRRFFSSSKTSSGFDAASYGGVERTKRKHGNWFRLLSRDRVGIQKSADSSLWHFTALLSGCRDCLNASLNHFFYTCLSLDTAISGIIFLATLCFRLYERDNLSERDN